MVAMFCGVQPELTSSSSVLIVDVIHRASLNLLQVHFEQTVGSLHEILINLHCFKCILIFFFFFVFFPKGVVLSLYCIGYFENCWLQYLFFIVFTIFLISMFFRRCFDCAMFCCSNGIKFVLFKFCCLYGSMNVQG